MAVTDEFLEFIPKLRAWARANSRIRRAWIFGSRLRGTQATDSDIDIALEIEPLSESLMADWAFDSDEWKSQISGISSFEVQLEWYGGEATPKIYQFIACCSMLVYERA